jgi:hypothetical protein
MNSTGFARFFRFSGKIIEVFPSRRRRILRNNPRGGIAQILRVNPA